MDLSLGTQLSVYYAIPFVGMLLSIALGPILISRFWHHNYGKISFIWAVLIIIPLIASFGEDALYELLHVLIADYIPFIVLLGALFTVGGGILVHTSFKGTTFVNASFLVIGSLLASVMGTTGAAMLLIRPFLRINRHRKHRRFMVVFFIFMVANVGGSLTPLGDPPLFLGYLHGVPFFWTLRLFLPMMILISGLLLFYIAFDIFFQRKEQKELAAIALDVTAPEEHKEKSGNGEYSEALLPSAGKMLEIKGSRNFILLAVIIGAILFSGSVNWGEISILGVQRGIQDILRELVLVAVLIISIIITPKSIRKENEFTMEPLKEVAYLFFGIFITMAPVLSILKAGGAGAFNFITSAVKEPLHYFWITGALSSFLDNAPTYLTFFSTVLGQFYPNLPEAAAVGRLLSEHPSYLLAISAGAVFMGASTYIGNAPNFMVRSIAKESGVSMPGFFGYMVYSAFILLPLMELISLIFF